MTDTRPPRPLTGTSTDRTAAVLGAFAHLTGRGDRVNHDVTAGRHPLVWLGLDTALTADAGPPMAAARRPPDDVQARLRPSAALDRLAALDALHEHERLLREGWVFVVGRGIVRGERRRVCVPLAARPVRLVRRLGSYTVVATGDLELTPLVGDPAGAAALERDMQFGGGALLPVDRPDPAMIERLPRLTGWIRSVADAAGLPVTGVLPWTHDPADRREGDGLVAVVGAGLHLARDVGRPGLGDVLREWARAPGIRDTAFGHMYAAQAPPEPVPVDDEVTSPLPLTSAQQAVVVRARREAVVAVSGAPGNGKSHTVAAIAVDAIAGGRSVLVATPTRYAADVIGDLLRRQPGPDPVLFGSTARRQQLAANLADGVVTVGRRQVQAAEVAHRRAAARLAEIRDAVTGMLLRDTHAQRLAVIEPLVPMLRRAAPRLFADDADLDRAAALLDGLAEADGGPVGRVRGWLAERRLRQLAGGTHDPDRLERALGAARSVQAAATLAADGGTRIGALWDELFAAERVVAERLGELLSLRATLERGASRARVRAVAALAAALRSGRAARRAQLRSIDAAALSAALPLWVGALTDVDDLLPPVPGMFDLLILDEASQIEQPRAAPALLRAGRVVVVGDPRQLRHVSFVSDADQYRALDEAGITGASSQLDVRRMSAFDAAAAVTTVTFLDEHHRSVPHLIAFSARRFYGDRVRLRTRHPANESLDAISIVRTGATTDAEGVVVDEVAAAAEVLARLAAQDARSIGVVSPFRAQADALEQMVLDRFGLDEIDRLGLRVGTAHAFQGAERDVVVVALGLTDDAVAQRARFVEDPNLFNVLVTRARHRMIVVTALTAPTDGLVADYLAYARHPPPIADDHADLDGWPAALAAELRRQGATVRQGYRVGAQRIDLVVGDGEDARAVECRTHPDGVAAHIARRRLLHAAGWAVAEAWPSRHDDDPIRAALDVLAAGG